MGTGRVARLAAFVLAAILLGGASGGEAPKKDPWAGFRDLKWGDELAKVRGMRVLAREGGDALWSRPGDQLAVGEAKLDSVNYMSWQGKLLSVSLIARGLLNAKCLAAGFRAYYGPSRRREQTGASFSEEWIGPDPERARAAVDYDSYSREVVAHIISSDMRAKRERDLEASGSKAGKDL